MPARAARRRYASSGAAVAPGPVNPSPRPAWQCASMIIGSLRIGGDPPPHGGVDQDCAIGLAAHTRVIAGDVDRNQDASAKGWIAANPDGTSTVAGIAVCEVMQHPADPAHREIERAPLERSATRFVARISADV